VGTTTHITKNKLEELEKRIEILEGKVQIIESLLTEYFPFSIDKLLEQRQLKVVRENREIPVEDKKLLYKNLKSYHFRRVLHDVLFLKEIDSKKEELLSQKWGSNVKKYLKTIKELDIVSKEKDHLKSNFSVSFMGNLLEWFIGKYLEEELHLETIINVRLKNFKEGGDVDVLSRIGTKFIMIESKESPPNNIPVSELKSIVKRAKILKPDLFILAIDTTLSIQRNIIDNLKWILKIGPQRVKEGVYKAKKNFFIINAKRDLLQNIEFCVKEGINGIW
jgi:hypothetical protein